jgi:hypothetical protein
MNKAKAPSPLALANHIALQAAIKGVAQQRSEIASLRKEIQKTRAQINELKTSPAYQRVLAHKDKQIAELKSSLQGSLRVAGLAPSNVDLNIDPVGSAVSPVEAYNQALEFGDKKAAAEIFAAHKNELFAARK